MTDDQKISLEVTLMLSNPTTRKMGLDIFFKTYGLPTIEPSRKEFIDIFSKHKLLYVVTKTDNIITYMENNFGEYPLPKIYASQYIYDTEFNITKHLIYRKVPSNDRFVEEMNKTIIRIIEGKEPLK